MKKLKKILAFLLIGSQLFSSMAFAAPQEFTQTVLFSQSSSRSRSQVVNIKDLGEVKSIVVNTGSVNHSVSNENVTVNVSNGNPVDSSSHTPSTSASHTSSSSSNSFSSSYYYSSGGYSGSINKSGSSYQYVVSPSDSRFVSEGPVSNTLVGEMTWGGSSWWISKAADGINLPDTRSYSSGGYTGTLTKSGYPTNDPLSEANSGPDGKKPGDTMSFNWDWVAFYSGTVTRPAVYGYKQDYSGTVYGATQITYYYAYTVTITYTKKVNIPTPPTFTNVTSNQIRVNWTSNGNEAGTTYQLYCDNTGSIIYDGTNTSFLHTGLSINTLYTYKVKAINTNNVESAYSASRSVSTLAVDPLPDGFDNLTHNSVRLKWLHNGNPVNTEYQYIVKNAGTNTVVKSGWVVGTNGTATGLIPNTQYDLYVKVRNRNLVESPNEIYIGRTYTLSAVPINLTISNPTQTSLAISWGSNLNRSGTLYQLYNVNSGNIIYEGTSLSFTHSGLTPDTVYTYRVRSVNANSIASAYTANASKITLPHTIVSNGITSITSSSMTGNINSINTSSSIRYYFEIEDESGNAISNSGWITGVSRNFSSLLPNKKYRVYATVRNDSGSLPRILIDTKATLPNIPGVPVRQASSIRLNNVLSWAVNSNPAGTIYELYVKPLGGAYSIHYSGTINSTNHSYAIWNSFYYKVRAKNFDGSYSDFGPEYFYTDVVKPVGQSIIINGGDIYANHKTFSLAVSATDDLSGVSQMRFRINASPYTELMPYSTNHVYAAPNAFVRQGTNQIFVEFVDLAGNVSLEIFDDIIFDDISPMGSLTYPQYIITEQDIFINAEAYDINPSSADFVSGLRNVRFREFNKGVQVKPWSAWEAFSPTKFWSFEPGDGLKEVEMEISDRAGNTSVVKLSVVMDTLFIHKAQFTDIVNPPLKNPQLPTSELVNIKKGYNFTVMVETMGEPDHVMYGFNGFTGDFVKIKENLYKATMKIDKDDSFEKGIIPINITATRTSDGAFKQTTLKVNVVGSAYDDYDVNNTN